MPEYVRRLTTGRFLTYHHRLCHQVKGKDGAVEVADEEVQAAIDLIKNEWFQRVLFEDKQVFVNVCHTCLSAGPKGVPPWPPGGSVATT